MSRLGVSLREVKRPQPHWFLSSHGRPNAGGAAEDLGGEPVEAAGLQEREEEDQLALAGDGAGSSHSA
jgi:hypothetical protein